MEDKELRGMKHNCTNCSRARLYPLSGTRGFLVCGAKESKEYENQVDRYNHCGYWRRGKEDNDTPTGGTDA